MNLYLLVQRENTGYDTYDSCVVAAANADLARLIRPSSYHTWEDLKQYDPMDWASKPENVEVILLGTAIEGTEDGIVISSFNAG